MKSQEMSKYTTVAQTEQKQQLSGQRGLFNRIDNLCKLASLHLPVYFDFSKSFGSTLVTLLSESFKTHTHTHTLTPLRPCVPRGIKQGRFSDKKKMIQYGNWAYWTFLEGETPSQRGWMSDLRSQSKGGQWVSQKQNSNIRSYFPISWSLRRGMPTSREVGAFISSESASQ